MAMRTRAAKRAERRMAFIPRLYYTFLSRAHAVYPIRYLAINLMNHYYSTDSCIAWLTWVSYESSGR